ncbi:MAG TPA: hypothetical protein VGM50_03515 [Gemmatimonadaceae bacterium]
MASYHSHLSCLGICWLATFVAGCGHSPSSARRSPGQAQATVGITRIDAKDTAAYAEAGPEAIDAVARCRPPGCRPDIFRGPGPGELTIGLDSGPGQSQPEYQWHLAPDTVSPRGQAFQDSSWSTMLTKWEAATPQRLLIIDGTPRSFAYARAHVSLASISGIQELSAKEATAVSSEPAAANGAVVITTKAEARASSAARR